METRIFTPEVDPKSTYNNSHLKQEMGLLNVAGMSSQSTVVTIVPENPPVRDHLIWSLFNAIYMNFCCLGVIALVFSVKSRDRKLLKDQNGATHHGSKACVLNIVATVLSVLCIFITIIIYAVLLNQTANLQQPYNYGK